MDRYVELKNYARQLDINQGDVIFISSDTRKIMWDAMSHGKEINLDELIDGFIEAVGEEGTVLFPTYNWDFCKGKAFEYHKTPCRTGTLGTLALGRPEFKRTSHPIYSFAVWGKHAPELLAMENKDSFGGDSPFAFFHKHNIKNYIIDVSLQHSFTFVHYVEEQSGVVKHRFVKDFTADYIDEHGYGGLRTYSMFVRDLDLDVKTTIDPIEKDFTRVGAEKEFTVNNSVIKRIYLGDSYPVLLDDIVGNRSRKLCTYKGQED